MLRLNGVYLLHLVDELGNEQLRNRVEHDPEFQSSFMIDSFLVWLEVIATCLIVFSVRCLLRRDLSFDPWTKGKKLQTS